MDWLDLLAVQGTLESSPTPQFKINRLLYQKKPYHSSRGAFPVVPWSLWAGPALLGSLSWPHTASRLLPTWEPAPPKLLATLTLRGALPHPCFSLNLTLEEEKQRWIQGVWQSKIHSDSEGNQGAQLKPMATPAILTGARGHVPPGVQKETSVLIFQIYPF